MKTLCNPMSNWSYLPRPLIQLHSAGPSFDAKPFLFLCLMFLPESHSMFKRAEHSPAQLLHRSKKRLLERFEPFWTSTSFQFLRAEILLHMCRGLWLAVATVLCLQGCNFWCELQCNIQLQCPKGVYSVCVIIASRHVFNWRWLRYVL